MPRVHQFNTIFTPRPGMITIALPMEGAPTSVSFINLVNLTNSGGVYTSTASTNFWKANMVSSLALPGDGYVQWPLAVNGTPEMQLVGFDAASTHTGDFETVDFCITNYQGRYHRFKNSVLTDSGVSAVAGDLVRVRRDGTTLYYEYSRGGGAFVILTALTDTGVTGTLTIHVLLRSLNDTITGIIASGLA